MKYTVEYFIRFFRKIPDNKWCVGNYVEGEKMCALGHCGETNVGKTKKSTALSNIFIKKLSLTPDQINDGEETEIMDFEKISTPKKRILAALEMCDD